jgi:hypothetical protein
MKRSLILGAALFASVSSAEAIECASELPAVRSGHWSYRIIDGRRCWYKGANSLPKSLLHWRGRSLSNAQAKMPVSAGPDFVDPEDGSCCWPPLGNADGFESRWRALLEARPERVEIGSQK